MPVLPPVPQAPEVPGRSLPASLSAPHTPEDLIALADKHCVLLPARPDLLRPQPDGKDVVLVTGTTGNFGCVLLEALLENPGVSLVYAVNRRGSRSLERQRASFRARELDEDLLDSDKLRFVEAELAVPGLGLDEELLDEIRGSVSHIIHNAWQVNFNLPLASFELHIRSLRHLVDLALSSSFITPPKIQFVSSIAVFQGSSVPLPVDEEPTGPEGALGSGYGESKWVAERILLNVADRSDVSVQIVRLGQTCGDRNGYWNEVEWFPSMVKSALSTRCLPDIDGSAAYLTNDSAARALVEMWASPETILHLIHPRPARLRTLITAIADDLDVIVVPYSIWINALLGSAQSISEGGSRETYVHAVAENPALALLDFFRELKLNQGREVAAMIPMSTEKAQAASATLRHLPALGRDVSARWLAAWRDTGFME